MPVLLAFCCSYSLECHLFANSPLVECLRLLQEHMQKYSPDPRNPYAFNPAFDAPPMRPQPRR